MQNHTIHYHGSLLALSGASELLSAVIKQETMNTDRAPRQIIRREGATATFTCITDLHLHLHLR